MSLFRCLCSMLFATDVEPLTALFNTAISFFILACVAWVSMVLLIYRLFGVTLSWYPKFEGNQTTNPVAQNQYTQSQTTLNTRKNQKVHFSDDVHGAPANETHLTDLRDTRQGEQLFIDGYLSGYKDGKRGMRPFYTMSDSWKEAGEEALENIRQSFVHDEEELRRAMVG